MRQAAIAVSSALALAMPAVARADVWASRDGKCEVTAPAGWKQGPAGKGSVVSADGKSDAWVDGNELSFDMFRQAILPSLQASKVVKSTPTYYAAELKAGGQKHTRYIITARGKSATCRVELHYDAKDAAAAQKIGDSLRTK
jgi:hypothetical protein